MLDAADILDLEFEVSDDLGKIMFLLKSIELLFLTFLRIVLHNFARTDFVIREVLASFSVFFCNLVLFSTSKVFQVFLKRRSSVTRSTFKNFHYVCHHKITQRVQI